MRDYLTKICKIMSVTVHMCLFVRLLVYQTCHSHWTHQKNIVIDYLKNKLHPKALAFKGCQKLAKCQNSIFLITKSTFGSYWVNQNLISTLLENNPIMTSIWDFNHFQQLNSICRCKIQFGKISNFILSFLSSLACQSSVQF